MAFQTSLSHLVVLMTEEHLLDCAAAMGLAPKQDGSARADVLLACCHSSAARCQVFNYYQHRVATPERMRCAAQPPCAPKKLRVEQQRRQVSHVKRVLDFGA